MNSKGRAPAAGLLVLGLLAGACGDQPLARVGDISQRAVHGDTTTTVVAAGEQSEEVLQPPSRPSAELRWLNDHLTPATGDTREVLSAVWERGRAVTSGFVQASREEISVVLPEVRFPGVVPVDVEHITSQLVFDTTSGVLDLGTSAAFGLWSEEPYSVSRSVGQLAVLRVGQNVDPNVPDDDLVAQEAGEGLTLRWQHRGYTYELFCRRTLAEAACWEMATSGRPLRTLDL